jgi:hypothetical protein
MYACARISRTIAGQETRTAPPLNTCMAGYWRMRRVTGRIYLMTVKIGAKSTSLQEKSTDDRVSRRRCCSPHPYGYGEVLLSRLS